MRSDEWEPPKVSDRDELVKRKARGCTRMVDVPVEGRHPRSPIHADRYSEEMWRRNIPVRRATLHEGVYDQTRIAYTNVSR